MRLELRSSSPQNGHGVLLGLGPILVTVGVAVGVAVGEAISDFRKCVLLPGVGTGSERGRVRERSQERVPETND